MSFALISSAYTSTSPMAAHIVGCGINSYNPKYLMYIVKKFLQIFSVLLLSFISVVVIGMVKPQIARAAEKAPADTPSAFIDIDGSAADGIDCIWQTTGSLRCTGNDGFANYSLDPVSSLEANNLVFRADFGSNPLFGSTTSSEVKEKFGYVHFTDRFSEGKISKNPTDGSRGYLQKPFKGDYIPLTLDKDKKPNEAAICSLSNLVAGCLLNYDQDNKPATRMSQENLDKVKDIYERIKEKGSLEGACEASGVALPFILCPIFNGTTESIAGLVGPEGLLNNFLTVRVNQGNADQNPLQDIVQQIIGLANAIYVLIFILLIFSASLPLGLDNYSIKKMLPKFVGAVIMTQFAYPITIGVVEFFNLLGNVVPNVIFSFIPLVDKTAPDPGVAGSAAVGVGLGVALGFAGAQTILAGIFIIIILLAIVALIAVIISFVFLTIRLIIIYILILLAPLAFASWVLPGTEKFFTNWWKNFIRLNAMFPMITGLLAVSILLSKIFLAIGSSN